MTKKNEWQLFAIPEDDVSKPIIRLNLTWGQMQVAMNDAEHQGAFYFVISRKPKQVKEAEP